MLWWVALASFLAGAWAGLVAAYALAAFFAGRGASGRPD